ncbi:MAG: hypothetical protein HONBIEJF_02490 [Fimbriimonadaceae bacterium]|nr:hypothetical protein [Fimbriimonadaceae bacterium]
MKPKSIIRHGWKVALLTGLVVSSSCGGGSAIDTLFAFAGRWLGSLDYWTNYVQGNPRDETWTVDLIIQENGNFTGTATRNGIDQTISGSISILNSQMQMFLDPTFSNQTMRSYVGIVRNNGNKLEVVGNADDNFRRALKNVNGNDAVAFFNTTKQ